jgi:hypothetical protein
MSQVMFSQPMSEVYVVFHKSAICAFEKTLWFRSKKICFIKWGRKNIVLFVYCQNSTRSYCCYYYYYYTTYLLLPLQLQIYNLLLMALEIAFGVQLSRYNSKKVLLSQTSILPLKQLRHTTTTTTDDSKLGVIVPLFSMSYMKLLIYNKPFYYNNSPGMEKHLDRGFLLTISRYNLKKKQSKTHNQTSHIRFSSVSHL